MRRRAYEDGVSLFGVRHEDVLLGFIKPVNFVYKKYCLFAFNLKALLRLRNDAPYFIYAARGGPKSLAG